MLCHALLKVRQGQRSCHWHRPWHDKLVRVGYGGQKSARAGEQRGRPHDPFGGGLHGRLGEDCGSSGQAAGRHKFPEYTVRDKASDWSAVRRPGNQKRPVSITIVIIIIIIIIITQSADDHHKSAFLF